MRLQKYFSEQKILSRRETEEYILRGKIKVNGEIVKDLGRQVDPNKDAIEIVGQMDTKTTIAINKPRGISSSKIRSEGKNIFDLFPQFANLNAIGRLDKESEGLILISNDGPLTNLITGKDHEIEKEYVIEVQERITQTKMKALSQGVVLEDGPTLPAKAKLLGDHKFSLIIKEGRRHQIRRMCDKIGLTVRRLRRIRIGNMRLGNLSVGGFRIITGDEIKKLK
jgi:pseudouridine synthase